MLGYEAPAFVDHDDAKPELPSAKEGIRQHQPEIDPGPDREGLEGKVERVGTPTRVAGAHG
jgi:hypothetical protein